MPAHESMITERVPPVDIKPEVYRNLHSTDNSHLPSAKIVFHILARTPRSANGIEAPPPDVEAAPKPCLGKRVHLVVRSSDALPTVICAIGP